MNLGNCPGSTIGLKPQNGNYRVAIYFHIPFCKSKCIYCDFYSVTPSFSRNIESTEELYVDRLLQEYSCFIQNLDGINIETIYIGGGTPSFLKTTTLEKLFNGIVKIYEGTTGKSLKPKEWTVEANPESFSYDFLNLCNSFPVTRISLGIQTLEDKFLKILRRPGRLKDTLKAITLLINQWNRDVNFDVISGIPGEQDCCYQTEDSLLHDLEFLTDLDPSHVSLYALTVEEQTLLHKFIRAKKLKIPDTEYADRLWFKGKKFLEERGYVNYEISNFARPGKESRHNLYYWELNPYIGIGASAVSTLPLGDTQGDKIIVGRLKYKRNIKAFLNEPNIAMEVEKINNKEFLFENLMMGLRLKRGINKKIFKRRFKKSLFDILPRLKDSPCFEKHPLYYRLREECRFLLNRFLIALDTQMETVPEWQIQVEWPQDMHLEK